ncbi:MAG TPA: hypothetical protein VKE22_26100 [Haliangiales bacterium]|nr:hypothetical protein [Haliangiales bacterium]
MHHAARAIGLILAASVGRAEPPPLIVFHSAADPPSEVTAARAAVASAARDAGAAFVDVTPAPAPPPAAATLLARAVESYDALRYNEALETLDGALAEAARSGAAGLSPAELSDLHLYRGLVVLQRGDANRAWDDLVRSALVDPARILDPLRFPPKATAAFQRAAREVRAQPRGTLVVATAPGCRAFVDAREVAGLPPELPLGVHYVRAACPGAEAGAAVLLGGSRLEVPLAPAPPAPPSDESAAALARARGARTVLVVAVTRSGGAPPTVWLRLRDVASGRALADASVALDPGGSAAADARAATIRLVDRATGAVKLDLSPPPRPWYEKPWVWGVAAAAVTAAILLPFAITAGSPTGFRVAPQVPPVPR